MNRILSLLKIIGVYLLPLALLIFGMHYHAAKLIIHLSAVIAIVIITIAFYKHRFKEFIGIDEPRFIYSIILLCAAVIVYFFTMDNPSPLAERMVKNFSIPAAAFALILALPFNSLKLWKQLKYTIPLSAIAMSIPGIYDYWAAGYIQYRTGGMVGMPIIYATNISILGISAFIIAITHRKADSWLQLTLATSAYILTILAIICSGSRGPLISLMSISILVLIYLAISETNKKYIFILVASALLFGILIPNTPIGERLTLILGNISEGREHTSLGIRIEMWRAGLNTIANNALTGVGIGKHDVYFIEQLKTNSEFIKPSSLGFVHLHNDIINIIVWIGIPAGLVFLLALWYPICHFGSALIKRAHRNKQISLSGISVTLVFILNGLTNTPATRASSITLFFLIITLLIYCLPTGSQDEQASS